MNKRVTEVLAGMSLGEDSSEELNRLRREITILFSDMQGSTSYFERFGDGAGLALVYRVVAMQRPLIEQDGGRVIKTMGDGLMAAFEDPLAALRAATTIQRTMKDFNAHQPKEHQAVLRIGINCGLGLVKSDDVFGDVVNVASRVQSAANPAQVAVSAELYAKAASTPEFHFTRLGKRSFKGKSEEQQVYLLDWAGTAETVVEAAPTNGFALLHIAADGTPGRRITLGAAPITLGTGPADVTCPDPQLAPQHARLGADKDSAWIEPVDKNTAVYVAFQGTHPLKHGDVIKIGQQLFRYQETEGAMAAAAQRGMTLIELESQINLPAAELVNLTTTGQNIPVRDQDISFGRTQGTCTFPNDGYMSRAHARIYHRGIDVFLEDLGSRNGTFVQITTRTALQRDTRLQLASQVFQIIAA